MQSTIKLQTLSIAWSAVQICSSAPIVQGFRTLPFHGSDRSSNLLGSIMLKYCLHEGTPNTCFLVTEISELNGLEKTKIYGQVCEWLKHADCKSATERFRWFKSSPAHHAHYTGDQLSWQSVCFARRRSGVRLSYPPPRDIGQVVMTQPCHGCSRGSIPLCPEL